MRRSNLMKRRPGNPRKKGEKISRRDFSVKTLTKLSKDAESAEPNAEPEAEPDDEECLS